MLSLAGIPLTSGFTSKWAVFAAAMNAGAWPVVIVAVLGSAAAAFFYIRVIVLMYFHEPIGEGPSVTMPSVMTSSVIAVGVAATLVLGLVPGPLLDMLGRTAQFIR
jgi:NADH-quinone oxidoreductase subunit N